MTASTRRAVSMFTDGFSSDDIEAAARRTGFVKRTAKMTGQMFLALVPCGVWSEANPTLAPLAAKVTQLGEQLEVSPAARHQRLNKRAQAFLPAMRRQARATAYARAQVCAEGLLPYFPKLSGVASTGFGLPESLHDLLPGAGGSAATAGAKLQAAWDDKSRLFGPCALTPGNIPENTYVDPVVALAQTGGGCLGDVGSVTGQAFARLAEAGASLFSRLHHQTTRDETGAGRVTPRELVSGLNTVKGTTLEQDIGMGAQDQGGARRSACRGPETRVNERRSTARKNAQQKGDPPSPAPLTLFAWHLCITHVPGTIWKTETGITVSPGRWQIELICTSWKSALHGASSKTQKADPPGWSLYGRLRLIVLT